MTRAFIPSWLAPFVEPKSQRLMFTYPLRRLVEWLWFWPFRAIYEYTTRDVEFFYPDYCGGHGTKIRPWFGLTIVIGEGNPIRVRWWRHLQKYKMIKVAKPSYDR